MDFVAVENHLTTALALSRRPIAIAFRESPPAGVAPLTGTHPSGCSFWRLAAMGQVFYTVPSDHYNCPVGSYTHNMPLPEEREPELTKTLSLMVNLGYMRMDDVPAIDKAGDVWPHSTIAFVQIVPMDGELTVEIGYRTAWDEEHTLGARFQNGMFSELSGSVLEP